MVITVREATLHDLNDIFIGNYVYIIGFNIESSVIHENPEEMCNKLENAFHYFDQAYIKKIQRPRGITYSVFDNTVNIMRQVETLDELISEFVTMKLEAARVLGIDPFNQIKEFEVELYLLKV